MLHPIKGTGQSINDLQRLAAKRNFDVCFRLNGMITNIHSIKQNWKLLDTKEVERALLALQEAVDLKWEKERRKLVRKS